MANVKRLIEYGFPVPLASELAKQIQARSGNAARLRELSMEPMLAQALVPVIASGPVSATRMIALGMPSEQAREVARQITADRPA